MASCSNLDGNLPCHDGFAVAGAIRANPTSLRAVRAGRHPSARGCVRRGGGDVLGCRQHRPSGSPLQRLGRAGRGARIRGTPPRGSPDHRLASGVWSRSALPADVSHRSPARARRVHPLSQEISRGPRRAPARSRPAPSGRSTTCSARGITVTASRRGCVARSSPPGPNSIARSTPNGCWARSRSPRSAGTKPSLRSSGPGSAASAHALGAHSFQLPHE
jgi:hypothetical protein